MFIKRTLPPAAAPIYLRDIILGIKGLFYKKYVLKRFKIDIEEFFKVKHSFFVSSGTAALTIILKAAHKINPDRDEIIIPAFTCFTVPSAIINAGLKIRLCDINPDTLDFDFNHMTKILHESKKVNCIIPTHLFGIPSDIQKLYTIVKDPKIIIIEDAAQAMGGIIGDQRLGSIGHAGFFSLGRGKALSTVEGGIIITNREDIALEIMSEVTKIPAPTFIDLIILFIKALLMVFLTRPSMFWLPKSLPFLKLGETLYTSCFKIKKMSSFQAGLAENWQKKLQKFNDHRLKVSTIWTSATKTVFLYNFDSKDNRINKMIRYPVMVKDKRLKTILLDKSSQLGLGIMCAYPYPINRIRDININFQGDKFPGAAKVARQLITLPNHPFVTHKDEKNILALISDNLVS